MADPESARGGESLRTVVVALAANVLVAVAKTVAAVVTGAASMLAEASHSWADAGNEIFLFIAQRRAAKPADAEHPLGYGREVYVWSLFAAIGLFAIGAGVSITHGIHELFDPEPAEHLGVAYAVLAVSFVLEAISFRQAARQARQAARERNKDLLDHILDTSDTTNRAVFFEDAAALVGIVIATAGVAAQEITGSSVPDAIGSILVGVLLGVVAIVLIDRNRQFLVGKVADPQVRAAVLDELRADPAVERVTSLLLEVVGASQILVVGSVDLVGDAPESEAARVLAGVEERLRERPVIVAAVLSLSEPHLPEIDA